MHSLLRIKVYTDSRRFDPSYMVHRRYTISPRNIFLIPFWTFHLYTFTFIYVRNRHTNGPKLEWQPQTTYFHVFHAFLSRLFYSRRVSKKHTQKKVKFSFSLFLVTALELKLNKNKTLGFSSGYMKGHIFFKFFFFPITHNVL